MADLDDARDRITTDITQTGALTAEAARRYEAMFPAFRAELRKIIDAAPSMEDAARTVMILTDAAANSLKTGFPHQPACDCRDGCSACCHLFVSVPPGVTSLIADHIKRHFSDGDQTALIDRLTEAARTIEQAQTTADVRARCPLLGADERCTIYEVRPPSCRAFTSASAQRCQTMVFGDAHARSTIRIDQNPAHYRLHMEATEALQEGAQARGLDGRQTGFVHALLDRLAPSET
jgi:Fe-S-cluster containining protein